MVVTCCSSGECMTMTVDPTTHRLHPTLPIRFSLSFRKYEASRALEYSEYYMLGAKASTVYSTC